jgi:hypothetical protein
MAIKRDCKSTSTGLFRRIKKEVEPQSVAIIIELQKPISSGVRKLEKQGGADNQRHKIKTANEEAF